MLSGTLVHGRVFAHVYTQTFCIHLCRQVAVKLLGERRILEKSYDD